MPKEKVDKEQKPAKLPPGAVLTGEELAELRRQIVAGIVNYTKIQVNAALQACEDYYEQTARVGFAQAMEAAAPGVFTNAQKKRIGAAFFRQKARREEGF